MKHLFHNFLNSLSHYKISSLLNIIGMSIAFASFYIIICQVNKDFNYNKDIEDSDRIFLIAIPSQYQVSQYSSNICAPLGNMFINEIVQVECGGMIQNNNSEEGSNFYSKCEDGSVKMVPWTDIQIYSPGLSEVFNLEVEQGNREDMKKPNAIAVTSSFARSNSLSIGDRLSFDMSGEMNALDISLIIKDGPANSDLGVFQAMRNIEEENLTDWSEWSYHYYVKLRSPEDKKEFEAKASEIARDIIWQDIDGKEDMKVTLVPIKDIFFSDIVPNPMGNNGKKSTDLSLLAVAILIIFIALINFINFFMALIPSRVRSVVTYKIFGADRRNLVLGFVVESLGLIVIATIISWGIVAAFASSSVSSILSTSLAVRDNVGIMLLTLMTALASAVIGSVYPALVVTSFQPALVVKGSFGSSTAGKTLRTILIGVQFAISIALIICASFVKLQHSYMLKYDMGFDKEYLISGTMPASVSWWGSNNEAFENILRADSRIKDIAWSDGKLVNTLRMGWGRDYGQESIYFQCYPVSYNFLDMMGINIVEGRNFNISDEQSEGGVIIFNEKARKEYGITMDGNLYGHSDEPSEIAGFCEDFHFLPLQYGTTPFAFYVFGKNPWRDVLSTVYFRTAPEADPAEVIKFITKTICSLDAQVKPEAIKLQVYADELGRQYIKESQLAKLISLFALIAIIISLMGVFGLVLFETQHRKKEIALRRVLGADIKDIMVMLNRKYAMTVIVCFIISAPLSYYIIDAYFKAYAYHHSISWWVFAAAFLIVLFITCAIVTLRSVHTATNNPVESIKTE